MEHLSLEITGMSCGHCVTAVTQALEQLDGVTVQEVKIGSADVSYDPGKATTARITRAIEDRGYAVAERSHDRH